MDEIILTADEHIAETALLNLKQSQEHLGELNDATVALQLLDQVVA
jgi:CHAD domain-containing protein